jgi:hypothetical protein
MMIDVPRFNVWARQAELPRIDGRPSPDGSAWARNNIVMVRCPYQLYAEGKPIEGIRINKRCAASLLRVLDAIWERCDKSQETVEKFGYHKFDGSYVYRKKRGRSSLSMHAYGRAIDFNADENQHHSQKHSFQNGDIIVSAFKAEGWVWGGDWKGQWVDAMHFQAARVR